MPSTWNLPETSLRQKSQNVDISDLQKTWFKNLLVDMFETLYSTPSGVGLAAPQIGVQLKIVVIDIRRDGKKPLVLINPKYTPVTDDLVLSNEGCLSVPKVHGIVSRYESIEVEYYDATGQLVKKVVNGFESKVFQHEIDHLYGILYIDKLAPNTELQEDLGHPNFVANNAIKKIYKEITNE